MERISKNYKMSEFAVSATASAKGINNEIPESVKPAIRALVNKVLQPISDYTEWTNVLTSGYRSGALNKAVGGAVNSQHTKGEAADCNFYQKINGKKVKVSSYLAAKTIVESGVTFDQMILYPTFVHLSNKLSGENRKQILYNKSYTGERL